MATGVAAAPVTVAHAAPVAVAHHAGYGKREAEPEADAEAEADAGHYGYAAAPLVAAAAPVCESVPVKTCNKVQQLAEYLTVVKYFCNCTNIILSRNILPILHIARCCAGAGVHAPQGGQDRVQDRGGHHDHRGLPGRYPSRYLHI